MIDLLPTDVKKSRTYGRRNGPTSLEFYVSTRYLRDTNHSRNRLFLC